MFEEEFFDVKMGLGVGSYVSKLYEAVAFMIMISFSESKTFFYFYCFKPYFTEVYLRIRNF